MIYVSTLCLEDHLNIYGGPEAVVIIRHDIVYWPQRIFQTSSDPLYDLDDPLSLYTFLEGSPNLAI